MTFKEFKKHGIAPRHLTKLLPISRTTASTWLNGHSAPNRYMAERLENIVKAIRAAEKYGEFPVPKEFKHKARDAYLLTIIKKYVEGPGKELAQSH